jgi:opacity protein-like surface antigen
MVCTCTLLIALAGSAKETEPDYGATGFYLGIGAAYAWDQFDQFSTREPDMAIGFDAWGGYRFLSYLAAELQLEYMNGFDVSYPWYGYYLEGEAVTFTGNLKAYLPLGRFQPFLMSGVGLGYVKSEIGRSDTSYTAFAARFGGGFDFYVTESLAFQISSSYVLQTGDLDGLDYVSMTAGLQYRF